MALSNSEKEINIARMISEGLYTMGEARRSASIQDLSFDNVLDSYGRIYEMEQCANEGFIYA